MFSSALEDRRNFLFSNQVIDKHLLYIYITSRLHINDINVGYLSETNKYPPTNEAMIVAPTTLMDWKKTPQESCEYLHPYVTTSTTPYC